MYTKNIFFQAGAWPLGQTTLTSFAVPQELEKPVQKVSIVFIVFKYESM